MGLSKSFGSQAQTSIKLGKLHTVPTTEDLLFVLSTATQNKKTAELPFSNPNNNASFTVKVTPATLRSAPRWTFERNAGQGNVVLWSRETNEVMMIQGKIKIESNYTGVFEPVQDGAEEQSLSESQTIVEDSPFLEDSAGSTARDGQTAPDQDITSPYQTQPGAAGLGQRRYEAWEQRDRPDAEGIQELQPDAAWQQEAQLGAWQEETKRDASQGQQISKNVGKILSKNISKILSKNIGKILSKNIGKKLSKNIGKILSKNIGKKPSKNFGKKLSEKLAKKIAPWLTWKNRENREKTQKSPSACRKAAMI